MFERTIPRRTIPSVDTLAEGSPPKKTAEGNASREPVLVAADAFEVSGPQVPVSGLTEKDIIENDPQKKFKLTEKEGIEEYRDYLKRARSHLNFALGTGAEQLQESPSEYDVRKAYNAIVRNNTNFRDDVIKTFKQYASILIHEARQP